MSDPKKNTEDFRAKVLKENPGIDQSIVSKHEKLARALEKAGIEFKSDFRLEPPLGSNRAGFHNRNS